ncbi:MAG: hypothetical protein SOX57_09015 [Schaalia hyovaginalis]|uniref:sensor histidine kinase n=1 Tax=Schaalia hyovaginalis TaxID=29316 RepID=UPI0023F9A5FD|nr:hypothetical protein [Schaalia hyovaginalis]MCI6557921.1 hypothetical protein [Schaalia hyovaginalis]MCI7671153.1 hypothetical protein [Schaalia hyovaginalis]MDD7554780.1 hypothetical protein [Schaalia hyovaginalis]MDY3665365.1 hypothetical protein [Schaalia hyovaginalis]MDY4263452.1 hypothetical protein [Schaalia hyovaginalis]
MSRSLHGTHQVEPSRFLRAFPFPALAVLLFLADVFFYPPTTAASTAFLAMMCVALGFAGRFPRLSSASFLILLFAGLAAPHELASIGLSALGVYAVAALWICKGWYIAAALALATYGAIHLPGPYLRAGLLELAIGAFLSVLIGVGGRRFTARLRTADTALALEKERSHALLAEARQSTAQILHDTAAAHLVRAIAAQEEALAKTSDPRLSLQLRAALDATRAAMTDLRFVIDASPVLSPAPDTLSGLLRDSERMLASHGIALDADVEGDLENRLDVERRTLLLTLVREGCVNVFKHAPKDSTASLIIESIDLTSRAGLELTLINEVGASTTTEASSGLGLPGLARQAAVLGARLETHVIADRWVLSARIPLARSEDEADR